MAPKITVYIPSHNYGRYLPDAIESVLRQTRDGWELLLVDDASTDNTPDVVQRYAGDPRVRTFRTEGVGLHGVGNLVLREAQGEYIIRLDGDDVFDENILLVLANYLDRNPDFALVFPDYYLIDQFGEIFAQERRQKLYVSNHMVDMPPHGACTMIRKRILDEIGGYRDDLKAQDGFYLWSKLATTYRSGNVNVPLFYYRRHGENLTNQGYRILEARRTIKRESIEPLRGKFAPIIGIIPCRKNYDFCPDVWSRQISNKSLLQIKLETCLASNLLDRIIVASDTPDVQAVLELFDDPRLEFFSRDLRETIRSESIVSTLNRIVEVYDPAREGIAVLSYVQNPLVSTATLEEAVCTLILNDSDCSFGVQEMQQPLFRRSSFGLQPVNPPTGVSTDFDTIYLQTNTFLATRTKNFRSGSLMGPRVVNFVVAEEEHAFVTSEHTLQSAAILYTRKKLFGA